jgi:hypothetical protein
VLANTLEGKRAFIIEKLLSNPGRVLGDLFLDGNKLGVIRALESAAAGTNGSFVDVLDDRMAALLAGGHGGQSEADAFVFG